MTTSPSPTATSPTTASPSTEPESSGPESSGPCHLVWFRDDLRTDDHPALCHACALAEHGGTVVGLYVLDDALWGRPLGGASRWWLHHSLIALRQALAALNIPLVLRRGDSTEQVPAVAMALHGASVSWTAGQTPFLQDVETRVAHRLAEQSIPTTVAGANLLTTPGSLCTAAGRPFRVFTPFWKALSAQPPATPLPVPQPRSAPLCDVTDLSEPLDQWTLCPTTPDWAGGLRQSWTPGEQGALDALAAFLDGTVIHYKQQRDLPACTGTSRLSPHLKFGELSPHRIWHAATALHGPDALPFLREVGWRDFNHHLLAQFPAMATAPLVPAFAAFPWRDDVQEFARWKRGQTGFPIVDAGMRELWTTGWMHNRVRMITASFLVKDLLLPWQWGEAWMWDTLVDACPANNPGNWQWVAGCGADAAPYFRVFNPTLQAQKFDPDGEYLRTWIPELPRGKTVEGSDLFAPSTRYPAPMVDHGKARDRALAALQTIKSSP